MLRQEQPSLELYSDFYDKIIPKDNLLRQPLISDLYMKNSKESTVRQTEEMQNRQ